jgi:alpha-glucuronidase
VAYSGKKSILHGAMLASFLAAALSALPALGESGNSLWLRYLPLADTAARNQAKTHITQIVVPGTSATLTALRAELQRGCDSLLAQSTPASATIGSDGAVLAGTPASSSVIAGLGLPLDPSPEAYLIRSMTVGGKSATVIASQGEIGALYGAFHLLRLLQTGKSIANLDISEKPKIRRRLLNHWDNLDGTIERGYAGASLWKWAELPGTVDPRYTQYARACASVGINGAVLNNVNNSANGKILSTAYIAKIAALANALRPYGVRIYLSAYFNAPQEVGGLSTSDPLNASVISWWAAKADEIYAAIPDFGGFLVKANSEGQPGPKTYGRTHAQGANCLADALAPHGGVVIWRAFVYDDAIDADRMKRAYLEFKPLDGKFRDNVIVQAKNGPFDFQPREPVHPLFGGLSNTHVGMECQITMEYLGQSTHLVYLAPLWKEALDFDTYQNGAGSTVAKVVDGSRDADTMTSIAGVANTGNAANWCGHDFLQANWFAFGRLAWNHDQTSEAIAEDWTRMTWGNSPEIVATIPAMMAGSREACVNYMTPLGLVGLFHAGDHYGPDPGYNGDATHIDYNSVYWHKADAAGLGYERSSTGSNMVGQYSPTVRDRFNNIATTPPEYLAVFHHVKWDYVVPSTGRTFWNELCQRYCSGTQYVTGLRGQWTTLNGKVDAERYAAVAAKLAAHETNANLWRTTCLNYFKTFSNMTIPGCSQIVTLQDPRTTPMLPAPLLPIYLYQSSGRLLRIFPGRQSDFILKGRQAGGGDLAEGVYFLRQGETKLRIVVDPR